MTSSAADKLSKGKIQQLLAAVGVRSQEDTSADLNAPEYNWRQCQYFNMDQCGRLTDFTRQVADQCSQSFSRLFNGDIEVSVVSAGQYFSAEIIQPDTESSDYAIAFGANPDDSFGIISMPRASAMAWTAQLLGGEEADAEPDRQLSSLEESLLLDIAGNLTNAFAAVYNGALQPAGQIAAGQFPIEWADDDSLYKITVEAKTPDAESGYLASYIVSCGQLETVAGKTDAGDKPVLSSEQIKGIVMEHIHDIPVSITAELGKVKVDFGAIMSLEVDDILILDKKVTEPVSLLINGRAFRAGRMAQFEGHYAVSVV